MSESQNQENRPLAVNWLIPLTVDAVLQFTSKNELARSFTGLGHSMSTTVAYKKHKVQLDGFSDVDYIHTPERAFFSKLKFHWRMLSSSFSSRFNVVLFGSGSAHLIPLARLYWIGRIRPVFCMDIRTIPVDLELGWRGWLARSRFRLALFLCDYLCDGMTVISKSLADSLRLTTKRPLNEIGIWASGVRLDHFKRAGDNKRAALKLCDKSVIFYHGVLSPNRGLQNLLRAIAILQQKIPDLVLVLVGEGPALSELEHIAEELAITDQVIFVGKVGYAEVAQYIRMADCAVAPFPNLKGWAVSSPIKLMEYLAVGVPIVATSIQAHKTVAEQVGGVSFAKNSEPECLADAIAITLRSAFEPVNLTSLDEKISWDSQAVRLASYLDRLIFNRDSRNKR